MKKILSSLLLIVLFLSQLQIGALYASEVEKLETQKVVSSQQLEAVGVVIDSAVEKLDTRMRDAEKSEQLEEKHEEINEYLEQVQQTLQIRDKKLWRLFCNISEASYILESY